jgi:hypothetical protein
LELLARQQVQQLVLTAPYQSVLLNGTEVLGQQQQQSQQGTHQSRVELELQNQLPILQPGSFTSPVDQQLLGLRDHADNQWGPLRGAMGSEMERNSHVARRLYSSTQQLLDESAPSQFRALQSSRSNSDQNSTSAVPHADLTNFAFAATNSVSLRAMTGLPGNEGQSSLEHSGAQRSDEQAAKNGNPRVHCDKAKELSSGSSATSDSEEGSGNRKPRARDDALKSSSSDSALLEPTDEAAIRRRDGKRRKRSSN